MRVEKYMKCTQFIVVDLWKGCFYEIGDHRYRCGAVAASIHTDCYWHFISPQFAKYFIEYNKIVMIIYGIIESRILLALPNYLSSLDLELVHCTAIISTNSRIYSNHFEKITKHIWLNRPQLNSDKSAFSSLRRYNNLWNNDCWNTDTPHGGEQTQTKSTVLRFSNHFSHSKLRTKNVSTELKIVFTLMCVRPGRL